MFVFTNCLNVQPVSLYILSAVFVSHPMCQSASPWRQREVNKSSEESCLLSSLFVGRQQNTNFDSLLRQQSDKTKIIIIIIIKTISQQQLLQNQGESCHLNERKWLAANLQQTNSEILMFQFSTFFFFFHETSCGEATGRAPGVRIQVEKSIISREH